MSFIDTIRFNISSSSSSSRSLSYGRSRYIMDAGGPSGWLLTSRKLLPTLNACQPVLNTSSSFPINHRRR